MLSWFAVHTLANAEAKAKYHLERQGFSTYLPRYLRLRRHARRTDRIPAPLFPRYLFVGFDPLVARWRAIQSTIGVSYLVGQGDSPSPVPDAVLQSLRAREDPAGFFPVEQAPRFEPGDPVRVVSGRFADAIGRFHRMSDSERVVVLLNFLGRNVKAHLPLEAVAANA
jgi:transcriptional antiterminator RfaH